MVFHNISVTLPHLTLITKQCYLHGIGWFYREHHFSDTVYIFSHLLHRKGDLCLCLHLPLNFGKIFVPCAKVFPKHCSGSETLQNWLWRLFRSSSSFFTNSIWYFILIGLVWFMNVCSSDRIPSLNSSSKCEKQNLYPSVLCLHVYKAIPYHLGSSPLPHQALAFRALTEPAQPMPTHKRTSSQEHWKKLGGEFTWWKST